MDKILTIDILPSDSDNLAEDVTTTPLALRINQTEMLSKSDSEYIISFRNELLTNRGWAPMEDWERSWRFNKASIWTPDVLTNIESWILPEYFHPEESDETKCVWANNRIGFDEDATTVGSGGFEQNTAASMPTFSKDTDFRNFEGLNFDGTDDVMRGKNNSDWNVGSENFLCYVAFLQTDSSEKQPVVAKNDKSKFLLECDWTGDGNAVYNMANNEEIVRLNRGADGFQIIGFGRGAGSPTVQKQWVRSYNFATETIATSAVTTDLDSIQKPGIGDAVPVGFTDEFDGIIYEIIFVNDDKGAGTDINDSTKEKIEGYLAWKYNVQGNLYSGHAYENEPPTKATRIS